MASLTMPTMYAAGANFERNDFSIGAINSGDIEGVLK
jgi:hypothetical protein